MKRLFKNIVLFLCLCAVIFSACFAAVQCIPPQFTNSCYAGMLDKYERLTSIDEPKLVLLGGSNLGFGMNSQVLEEAMQMPVVNMGFFASVKSDFYLNLTKPHIKEGDIVIICYEYALYSEKNSTPYELLYTIENYPEFWHAVPWYDYPYLAAEYFDQYASEKIPRMAIRKFNKPASSIADAYCRAAFNAWGDNAYPRPNDNIYLQFCPNDIFTKENIDPSIMKRLDCFYDDALAQGAKVFISFPPIAKNHVGNDASQIAAYKAALDEQTRIPIISEITEYLYEDILFYDSHYHLNDKGARLRTEQLISDLQAALGAQ